MAIASPSNPTFSASFCCNRAEPSTRLSRFSSFAFTPCHRTPVPARRLVLSSRLTSSKSSAAGGYLYPDNGGEGLDQYELQHGFSASAQRRREGSPVFVTLPVDVVSVEGELRRRKTMRVSLRALATAGVEGVVMEVWWGVVEREQPGVYDWKPYLELAEMAKLCGLKVRAILAFHQCGFGPEDPRWIPLPRWVLEEIEKDPDLAFSDRFGRKNMEYISIGCDILPVLRGRSPLQAYADFMRNFRDTFRPLLGSIITGIQVGMGPAGELRYPSCPSQKLAWSWKSHELGEFQCYDKYMLASLTACAREAGMREWGNWGPTGTGSLMQDPERTEFFRGIGGSWNTPYGKFFLEWYSGLLLLHGERICREAETIFRGTEVSTSAKVAGIHWHYRTLSHPSELTAGYYNTSVRDGYLPIGRLFGRHGFALCCSGFDMLDFEEKRISPMSSPHGLLRQLLLAARLLNVPVEGENSATNWDIVSFQQVIKMSKFYLDGLERPAFSFNFVRMDKDMFLGKNWNLFIRFVRLMSEDDIFRARLDFEGDIRLSLIPDAGKVGVAQA